MHRVNNSIKLSSLGKIQTWFICTLALWMRSSTLQYLLYNLQGWIRSSAIFFFSVSSLVERPSIMLPANRRVSDKSHAVFSVSFLFIVGYWESSKESSVFFLWKEQSVSLWNCSSRNSILYGLSAWPVLKCNQDGDVLENFEVHFFTQLWSTKLRCYKEIYVFINVS